METKKRYSDEELEEFRAIVNNKLAIAKSDYEETMKIAQRQQKFIKGLQAALVRIDNKTYGIDRITGELIPKERLRVVPHATLSVASKEANKHH